MRLVVVLTVALIGLTQAQTALAAKTKAPSGNSGLSQYLEVIPGAAGNHPSTPRNAGTASAGTAGSGSGTTSVSGDGTKSSRSGRRSRDELLLERFVSYSAPRSDAAGFAAQDDSDGLPGGIGATLSGDDGGLGMGRWLPLILLAALAAAVFAAVGRARR